jgi:alcohol dehydrogenase YqhD (iron-dependent ADH family)
MIAVSAFFYLDNLISISHKCIVVLKRFTGNRVLIYYGGGSVIRSGLLDRVKDSLVGEGIFFMELDFIAAQELLTSINK